MRVEGSIIYSGSGLHFRATACVTLRSLPLPFSFFFYRVAARNVADRIVKTPSQILAGKEYIVSNILKFIRIIKDTEKGKCASWWMWPGGGQQC